jgi:acyl-CoA-binding protein
MSDAEFKRALDYVTHGPKASLTDKQKLQMYGLFKQVTVGECKEKAPSALRFVKREKCVSFCGAENKQKGCSSKA